MTLNTLWETSLLSDDPWWLYLVYGAGWTISLAVASFALALTLGTIVGTLRTVDNKWIRGICEGWIELSATFPHRPDLHLVLRRPRTDPALQGLDDRGRPRPQPVPLGLPLHGPLHVVPNRRTGSRRHHVHSLRSSLRRQGPGFTVIQCYRFVILPMAFRLVLPPLTSEA